MINNEGLSEEIDAMFERSDQRVHEIYSKMLEIIIHQEQKDE